MFINMTNSGNKKKIIFYETWDSGSNFALIFRDSKHHHDLMLEWGTERIGKTLNPEPCPVHRGSTGSEN